MSDLYPDSREHWYRNGDVELFARVTGSGPPLLLIHGFPQTHAMWHKIVPELRQHFTCVLPDLRGYGLSSCPEFASPDVYAKRTMAHDLVVLMDTLRFSRFPVIGHDRGARVAYRMALDFPTSVRCLAVLDIVPTYEMWHRFDMKLAMKTYHWPFLAQPRPLPEMLIGRDSVGYLDFTLASWTKAKTLSAFDPLALAEYRLHYATPEHIEATCNDYRAGATVDLAYDEADRVAGRKIEQPTLALWGTTGIPANFPDPLAIWQDWCGRAEGQGIDSGHFVAEENPQDLLAALQPFLAAHGH